MYKPIIHLYTIIQWLQTSLECHHMQWLHNFTCHTWLPYYVLNWQIVSLLHNRSHVHVDGYIQLQAHQVVTSMYIVFAITILESEIPYIVRDGLVKCSKFEHNFIFLACLHTWHATYCITFWPGLHCMNCTRIAYILWLTRTWQINNIHGLHQLNV